MAITVFTSDIEARWRPLSPAEAEVAETMITSAIAQFVYLRPRATAALEAGLIPAVLVVDVICEAVQRVLRNPDLLRAQNITGDGGVGITYGLGEDTVHALPRLRISPEDLAAVDAAVAVTTPARSRVGSVKFVNE